MAGGTLEGTGPNKLGTVKGNCRDLGFTSITDNASISPKTSMTKASNPAQIASPLANMVDPSADSDMYPFPSGTLEGGGPNG